MRKLKRALIVLVICTQPILFTILYCIGLAKINHIFAILPSSIFILIFTTILCYVYERRINLNHGEKKTDIPLFASLSLVCMTIIYITVESFKSAASLRPGSALSMISFLFLPFYLIAAAILGYIIGWFTEVFLLNKWMQLLNKLAIRKVIKGIVAGILVLLCLSVYYGFRHYAVPVGSIYYASQTGNMYQVEKFIDRGVDINKPRNDLYKQTPLHFAAYSNPDMIKLLIESGAIVNSRDSVLQTPLHLASATGHHRNVAMLLQYGADVNAVDVYGNTALYKATRKGQLCVVKMLIEAGADVNLGSQPPILMAVKYGYDDVVKILVHNGADINITDTTGRSLLQIAEENGHTNIHSILKNSETLRKAND